MDISHNRVGGLVQKMVEEIPCKNKSLKYIRFHDLRHTSATLLINQGIHSKIIASRLGHANITTTLNTYAHALREADQAAANTFDQLFVSKNKTL
jgi:integrase